MVSWLLCFFFSPVSVVVLVFPPSPTAATAAADFVGGGVVLFCFHCCLKGSQGSRAQGLSLADGRMDRFVRFVKPDDSFIHSLIRSFVHYYCDILSNQVVRWNGISVRHQPTAVSFLNTCSTWTGTLGT